MIWINVEDIDVLHKEYQAKDKTRLGELIMQPWGKQAFSVLDMTNNLIWFCEPMEYDR